MAPIEDEFGSVRPRHHRLGVEWPSILDEGRVFLHCDALVGEVANRAGVGSILSIGILAPSGSETMRPDGLGRLIRRPAEGREDLPQRTLRTRRRTRSPGA